jgi:hypothetical protein
MTSLDEAYRRICSGKQTINGETIASARDAIDEILKRSWPPSGQAIVLTNTEVGALVSAYRILNLIFWKANGLSEPLAKSLILEGCVDESITAAAFSREGESCP